MGRKTAAERATLLDAIKTLHDSTHGSATVEQYQEATGLDPRTLRNYLRSLGIAAIPADSGTVPSILGTSPPPAAETITNTITETVTGSNYNNGRSQQLTGNGISSSTQLAGNGEWATLEEPGPPSSSATKVQAQESPSSTSAGEEPPGASDVPGTSEPMPGPKPDSAVASKVEVEAPTPPPAHPQRPTDPLLFQATRQSSDALQMVTELKNRLAQEVPAPKGKPEKPAKSPERRLESAASEAIIGKHIQRVTTRAKEFDSWLMSVASEVVDRWYQSGYRVEYPDPDTGPADLAKAALDFFTANRERVGAMDARCRELERENGELRHALDPVRLKEQQTDHFFKLMLTLKLADTRIGRDELEYIMKGLELINNGGIGGA